MMLLDPCDLHPNIKAQRKRRTKREDISQDQDDFGVKVLVEVEMTVALLK